MHSMCAMRSPGHDAAGTAVSRLAKLKVGLVECRLALCAKADVLRQLARRCLGMQEPHAISERAPAVAHTPLLRSKLQGNKCLCSLRRLALQLADARLMLLLSRHQTRLPSSPLSSAPAAVTTLLCTPNVTVQGTHGAGHRLHDDILAGEIALELELRQLRLIQLRHQEGFHVQRTCRGLSKDLLGVFRKLPSAYSNAKTAQECVQVSSST